jgi:hypothetical protein
MEQQGLLLSREREKKQRRSNDFQDFRPVCKWAEMP